MAILKACAFLILSALLLIHLTDAAQVVSKGVPSPSPSPLPAPKPIDCGAACGYRCSKTKRPNLCKRACGSCCAKCSCVPPGTSGNYEACPCYYNLTTVIKSTGKVVRKCP
ncbi:unnamed protein product [Coffea canephora]|uniref:Uncharacterized protein n=2 Tax=Coffea TaxID=13442 RepID=A0A068U063_COFCA|nr:unnamed protein product [Coffea canephora]